MYDMIDSRTKPPFRDDIQCHVEHENAIMGACICVTLPLRRWYIIEGVDFWRLRYSMIAFV